MSFRTTGITTSVDYVEDVSPGSGTLPPRAWYASSDARSLSLDGDWHFRLSPTADAVWGMSYRSRLLPGG